MEIKANGSYTVAESDFADQYCPPPKNELSANVVLMGSIKKVWWRCNKGHFFKKSPTEREKESWKSNGCPKCREELMKNGGKKRKKVSSKKAQSSKDSGWNKNGVSKKPKKILTKNPGNLEWDPRWT